MNGGSDHMVFEKVKDIIVDQLDADESEVPQKLRSLTILALIHST